MKIPFGRARNFLMTAAWLLGCGAPAQSPATGGPAGVSAALTKLFGNTTAFSARGEMRVTDQNKREVAFYPMDFYLLDRKIRVEIDLTQTRSKDMPSGMPANAAATLKQIGMARVISIIRPDKGLLYAIYPDQRVLLSMPLPKEDLESSGKAPQIAKTELGRETLDGHLCIKNKVVVSDATGHSIEATTWDAKDLKDLPIQIETQDEGLISTVRFKDVQFTRPSAGEFDPPQGYTQYDNPRDLQMGVMKKMMENSGKK
jgi:hypothetical protein